MAKRQIGFVPDHYALYEKLTGREYINYIADLYEVNQKERDKRINREKSGILRQTVWKKIIKFNKKMPKDKKSVGNT